MAYKPHERAAEQAFQTTDNLGPGEIYDSGIIDLRGWTQVDTRIVSDQNGLIRISWYSDEAGTDQVRLLNIPYFASNGFQLFSAPAFTPFNRYEFINGGVAQGDFFFENKLLHTGLSPQILGLTAFIADGMVAQLNRSIITGQQPDGDYVNARADGSGFTVKNSGLIADEAITTSWVDTDGFNGIDIFISTDQVSAFNGIQIEYTDDAQAPAPTILATEFYTYTQADVNRGFLELPIKPRLDGFRVRYTNGTVDQGRFFLQSDLRTNRQTGRLDQNGTLITGDFDIEAALGNIPNHSVSTKFGAVKLLDSADIAPGSPFTIWRLADDGRTPLQVTRKIFQTSNDNIYISSNNAADTNIEITMIINDENNNIRAITANTNAADGRTPVNTGVLAIDCNTAFVSGNNQTIAGDIYVVSGANITPATGIPSDPTKVLAFIPVGDQRTQQTVFRVPSNAKMIIKNIYATVSAGTATGSTSVTLRVKEDGKSWVTIRPYLVTSSFQTVRSENIVLGPNALVECIIDEVSGNNINSLFNFDYELIFGE